MAFEDRSSPSAAASPGSSGHHTVNSPESTRTTYSPESTRTTQYTCSTRYTPMLKQEPFLRITSYALSRSPKREPEEAESSSASERGEDLSTSRSNSPEAPHQQSIQQLKYSIINILQPDFGKSAISRTRASSKITFKPYENEREPEVKVDAPLGGLCKTVSQIGKVQGEAEAEVRSKSPLAALEKPATEEAGGKGKSGELPTLWPAWVYCTRYSDRPSSGPRSRRMKKPPTAKSEEKRPRTAFSGAQLARLKHEFAENRYLTERRRQQLSQELGLNEAQIKIWFQNKRAKIKKASGQKHPLALQLMAQGLYNHSTVACDEDDMPLDACGST